MKEVKERAVYAPTSGYSWDMADTAGKRRRKDREKKKKE
jgi:hypothetical protein